MDRTNIEADSAADTFILIDNVALILFAGDCSGNRADGYASGATGAFGVDVGFRPCFYQVDKTIGRTLKCGRNEIFFFTVIENRQIIFHGNRTRGSCFDA